MFKPKTHLPQHGYFRTTLQIPGTDWQLTGHSRAQERTGFWIPQLSVVFDAGVDLPANAGAQPKAIFITHGHMDHCNALPMLLRHASDVSTIQVFAPHQIIHRLRSFAQLSWALKVDIEDPLPECYSPPPEVERLPEPGSALDADMPYRMWRPCDEAMSTTIQVGKGNKIPISVQCLKMFHKRCSTVGYLLSTPSRIVKKVQPDLMGATKQETGKNVQAARARGENHLVEVEEPEQPKLAFVLDTQIHALMESKAPETAPKILSCPVVIIECTFLEESMKEEAEKRGHICWCELLHFVAQSVHRQKEGGPAQTWILVHFSLRYMDEQIVEFFHNADQSKIRLSQPNGNNNDEFTARPPDIVLWLDEGPKELWVDEVET